MPRLRYALSASQIRDVLGDLYEAESEDPEGLGNRTRLIESYHQQLRRRRLLDAAVAIVTEERHERA
jgi:hypothetical protein